MTWNSRYDKELIKNAAPIINGPTWIGNAPCGRTQCRECANVSNRLESSHDRLAKQFFGGDKRVTSRTLSDAFNKFRIDHQTALNHIDPKNPMSQQLVANYNTHVVPAHKAYQKFLQEVQPGENEQLSNYTNKWGMLARTVKNHFNSTDNADGSGNTWYNALLRGSQTQNRRLNKDPQWANPVQPQDKGLNSWQHGPEGFAQNPEA